jgi:hypothetical protein
MEPIPQSKRDSWEWPKGFEIGRTARVRDRPDSQGAIVELDAPSFEGDPPLVHIRSGSKIRWVVTVSAVQIRGIDFDFGPPPPLARRRDQNPEPKGARAVLSRSPKTSRSSGSPRSAAPGPDDPLAGNRLFEGLRLERSRR